MLRPTLRTRLTLWCAGLVLAILVLTGVVSYSLLTWSVMQDVDASLVTVAQVLRDTDDTAGDGPSGPAPEAALRDILGPEFYDKFFRLLDPHGAPGPRSAASPHAPVLPLSARARDNAARGERTFETIALRDGEAVRLLTLPVVRDGQVTRLVQVGMSLHRSRQAVRRYLEKLVVLVPLGVILAALGGALIARTALEPVRTMARTARRISAEDLSGRIARRHTGDELDDLAETLNATFERLASAFTEMRRFAADAAHELRTPLTALRGGIEVALRAERSGEEYRRVLRSSLEEVERLVRLAEDLLLLSRASAQPEKPRAPVDLEALVLDVLDAGVRLADAAGVSLRVGALVPAVVAGDPLGLRRTLLNLVENGVKYTPAGGVVELGLAVSDGEARLSVQDTGPGVDPADAERIFEPFVRLDAARARDTGGAGLGLAIARSIVRAHGGAITLASPPGGGARFTIHLPLARA